MQERKQSRGNGVPRRAGAAAPIVTEAAQHRFALRTINKISTLAQTAHRRTGGGIEMTFACVITPVERRKRVLSFQTPGLKVTSLGCSPMGNHACLYGAAYPDQDSLCM